MPEPFKLTRVPTLKTPEAFRDHVAKLGIDLPCFRCLLEQLNGRRFVAPDALAGGVALAELVLGIDGFGRDRLRRLDARLELAQGIAL